MKQQKIYTVRVTSLSLTHSLHLSPSLTPQLLSAVVNRDWTDLARYGSLDNWREILAVLVTYASPEDFAPLCGMAATEQRQRREGLPPFQLVNISLIWSLDL